MTITSAGAARPPRDLGSGQATWTARRSASRQETGALWQAALASALGTAGARAAARENRRAADRTLAAPSYRLAGNLENIELGYRLPD